MKQKEELFKKKEIISEKAVLIELLQIQSTIKCHVEFIELSILIAKKLLIC